MTFARGNPFRVRAGAALSAIVQRHNDNGVFRPSPVPEWLRTRLVACCTEPELRVHLTDDQPFRRWIDALTLEADRTEFADPGLPEELSTGSARACSGRPG